MKSSPYIIKICSLNLGRELSFIWTAHIYIQPCKKSTLCVDRGFPLRSLFNVAQLGLGNLKRRGGKKIDQHNCFFIIIIYDCKFKILFPIFPKWKKRTCSHVFVACFSFYLFCFVIRHLSQNYIRLYNNLSLFHQCTKIISSIIS